jgi:hypothetical protein
LASWLNASWKYRIPVTIDNSSNAANLSYYQASITLSGSNYTAFAARAKADGSDLRVTDSDGTTLLSHWLENLDATNSVAHVLVKIPAVAAGATRTIYLYYGNASASSVSSPTTTVGSSTSLTGPTDVVTQTDYAGYNCNPSLVRLRNQGGAHGGGSGLNGNLVCVFGAAGQGNGNPGQDFKVAKAVSTDGGSTWTKTTLLTPAAGDSALVRSLCELADGTLLLCYTYGTNAAYSTGKANQYVAKSTDGGVTWSNLTTRSSPVSVPWTVGTDVGTMYGDMVEKAAGGDLFMPAYYNTTAPLYAAVLLKCPSGSDPTVGTNWVTQGTIASSSTTRYDETAVVQTSDSSHYVAIIRHDTPATNGDLFLSSSSDSGATWSAAARINLPGGSSATSNAVSPHLRKLASGNILLSFGLRYSALFGSAAVLSTDGGASWIDRGAVIPHGYTDTTGSTPDYGYPAADQLADGTIVSVAYHPDASWTGVARTTNLAVAKFTEDYACNANNSYVDCESSTGWTLGANATVQSTTKHSGTNALKLDNSAGVNPYAHRPIFPTNTAAVPTRFAISAWRDDTAVGTAANTMSLLDSTATGTAVIGSTRRTHVGVWSTPFDVEWFNGTTWTDSGTATPLNRWNKLTVAASATLGSTTTTGGIYLNNASVATLGSYSGGTSSAPAKVHFLACSTASTHANTCYVDDVYTHQYTPARPSVSAGTEASGGGFVIRTRAAMSGGFTGGK